METIKRWVRKTKLGQELIREGSIDAFQKAHDDIKETFQEDIETRAQELAKQKLNDLLSPADLTKIVSVDEKKGIVFIGNERIEEGHLANLKAEAEFLENSEIWQLIKETPRRLAEKAMFVSGESLADMQKGKSILYTLSAQQNIVNLFKSYTPKK